MSGSSSFFVEEAGMGESSERPDLVDSDSEGDVKEETREEFARVEREINLLKKEKAVALLRGYPKKRVTEIQKKLSEKETRLGVLNEVQGLLRDVGEKEESPGGVKKGDVSLDGLDLSGRFQHQFSPVKPPAPDGPGSFDASSNEGSAPRISGRSHLCFQGVLGGQQSSV